MTAKANQKEGSGQIVRALDKALSVLLKLSQAEKDIDLATLSAQTGLPKSTLVRLLHTMRLHNVVNQDLQTRRYRLGWGLINLGKAAERQFDLEKIVLPFLEQLKSETGETSSFAILEGTRAVYVAQVAADSIIRGVPPIGSELELHCTAVGKVLLASYPDDLFEQRIVEHGLPRMTENTIVNSEQLRREVQTAAERGYAVDNEEAEYGGRCIASPIIGSDGSVIAAISITGPINRIREDRIVEYAKIVSRVANRVTQALRTFSPAFEDMA